MNDTTLARRLTVATLVLAIAALYLAWREVDAHGLGFTAALAGLAVLAGAGYLLIGARAGVMRLREALAERSRESAARPVSAQPQVATSPPGFARAPAALMLLDAGGRISEANDAALALFRSEAGAIRRQQPSFDPERVAGQSVEGYLGASAQRGAGSQVADWKLGEVHLRSVSAASGDGGSVLQWINRTAEVSTEEEVIFVVGKALEGDLSHRVRSAGKSGFTATLADRLNGMLDSVAKLIDSVTRAAAEVRTGAGEISRGNSNLSQRTEEQASSLEETASSMEEMTSTVKSNADNAGQANQLALAARNQAERGGSVVQSAVSAMSEINSSSKKIADIIGVIDEIAFQTNLLALNAAVEAARAGDQGRGFAVVAAEVRNLASRSAEAAKEIKGLIQDSVAKVGEGSKLVEESGRMLGEIVSAVKKVTDIVAEIAAASMEQSSGIEEVNKAVMSMDEMTQQNAALVEEAAAASQALSQQAEALAQTVAGFRTAGGAQPDWHGEERRHVDAWRNPPPAQAAAVRSARPARPVARPAPKKAAGGASGWNEF
jgi:methyl-accepting chemotaxis protein